MPQTEEESHEHPLLHSTKIGSLRIYDVFYASGLYVLSATDDKSYIKLKAVFNHTKGPIERKPLATLKLYIFLCNEVVA